jgi:hypothetical protein
VDQLRDYVWKLTVEIEAFEVIQNNMLLYITAREFGNMYLGRESSV